MYIHKGRKDFDNCNYDVDKILKKINTKNNKKISQFTDIKNLCCDK